MIIAGAGGAAHLPGMVAAKTTLPVIGVPVKTNALNGLDSLLSIVQMPGGVPVATVAIGKAGAVNAGLLAAQILSINDADVQQKLEQRREYIRKTSWKAVISLYKKLLPQSTIGIIGGGQLGKFMAIAAKNMGYRVAVLDPTPNSPCGQVSDMEITARYDDLDAIKELAKVSDCITYEFENIDYEALTWLEQNAYLPQGSRLLAITQDRQTEKEAVANAGVKVAPYEVVESEDDFYQAVSNIGIPSVLKTCRGGYDGKGQFVLKQEEDIEEAKALLKNGRCVLEKWIAFDKEISVIVTRSVTGEVSTLPVAENIHVNNILHESIVPARISDSLKEQAEETAKTLAAKLGLIGTLAVEMFVANDEIYINELAPGLIIQVIIH